MSAGSVFMFLKSPFNIRGDAGVERSVFALDNVNVIHLIKKSFHVSVFLSVVSLQGTVVFFYLSIQGE